jgi:hypothetical protein
MDFLLIILSKLSRNNARGICKILRNVVHELVEVEILSRTGDMAV